MTARRAALSMGAALALSGCAPADRPAPPAPAPAAPASAPRVVVETRRGARLPVTVEIARTDAERARGLMARASLPPDAGMLFVFEELGDHAFWMKNTLIPLDMIFIDDAGRITGIVARATPGSLEPRSAGPSRYVLEVIGGWAEERGVAPGDQVRFEGVLFR